MSEGRKGVSEGVKECENENGQATNCCFPYPKDLHVLEARLQQQHQRCKSVLARVILLKVQE